MLARRAARATSACIASTLKLSIFLVNTLTPAYRADAQDLGYRTDARDPGYRIDARDLGYRAGELLMADELLRALEDFS